MKFEKGKYKCRNGVTAIVARIRALGPNQWVIDGAIVNPSSGVLGITSWNILGENVMNPCGNFDLMERIAA